jgi:Trypsin-like peptidase domain
LKWLLAALALLGSPPAAADEPRAEVARAGWRWLLARPTPAPPMRPHPAVVRVVAPEREGASWGSGTLIDVRDKYGLVLTNWHVVCETERPVEVVFADGFRSVTKIVKLDRDWDLAALVCWKPTTPPVAIAARPPQLGEWLKIAGYGSGEYREASGRCTQFLSPGVEFPAEIVELDAAARQGDSGGPIFNAQGDLAGVLFGATRRATSGSHSGRVRQFLLTVVPRDLDGQLPANNPHNVEPHDLPSREPSQANEWRPARERAPSPPSDGREHVFASNRTESAAAPRSAGSFDSSAAVPAKGADALPVDASDGGGSPAGSETTEMLKVAVVAAAVLVLILQGARSLAAG